MRLGQEIEQIRCECNMPIYIACNMFDAATESEYHQIVTGARRPLIRQLIAFIIATQHSLSSINCMTYDEMPTESRTPTDDTSSSGQDLSL